MEGVNLIPFINALACALAVLAMIRMLAVAAEERRLGKLAGFRARLVLRVESGKVYRRCIITIVVAIIWLVFGP